MKAKIISVYYADEEDKRGQIEVVIRVSPPVPPWRVNFDSEEEYQEAHQYFLDSSHTFSKLHLGEAEVEVMGINLENGDSVLKDWEAEITQD